MHTVGTRCKPEVSGWMEAGIDGVRLSPDFESCKPEVSGWRGQTEAGGVSG